MSQRRRIALIIIVALLIPMVPFAVIGELPGDRWLSHSDDSAFAFGLTGALLLAADVLLPIPSSIVGTMLGARLGTVAGAACAFGGLMAGNVVGYAVGRLLLGRAGAKLPENPTLVMLFLSRPVPVLAEAACVTAGAARTHFAHFLAASAAGNMVYAAVLAANGAHLIPGSMAGPGLIIPMLMPAAGWLAWRWHANRKPATDSR